MTIEEMREKLTDLLIKSDYGSVDLARKIGITYRAFNRFVIGLQKTNMKTLMKIEMFLTAPPPRKIPVRKDGKRSMERIKE